MWAVDLVQNVGAQRVILMVSSLLFWAPVEAAELSSGAFEIS
jgi:hypothetical protein